MIVKIATEGNAMVMTRLPVGQKSGHVDVLSTGSIGIVSLKFTDETPWQGSKAMGSQVSSDVKKSVVNTDEVSEISGKAYSAE